MAKWDERIRRIRNARGMQNLPGRLSKKMTHCDCGAGVNRSAVESQSLSEIWSLDCAPRSDLYEPRCQTVSSCIEQSEGRDDFPNWGISASDRR